MGNNLFKLSGGLRLANLASAPTGQAGVIYFDTLLTKLRYHDGSNFIDVQASTNEFADNVFRVYDSATPTKKIAFEASGITAANVRTITMPDADVNLGALVDANISASAAIVRSKLASGTANRLVVNNGTGVMSDAAAITAARVLISDANGIPTHSTVTDTTLGYLDATSSIQTQLNGKEPTITTLPVSKGGTNSGTALSNDRVMKSSGGAIVEAAAITASRALISDANGIPTHSTVTSTTLGYLDATSSVQTQLNGKEPSITTLPISKGGTNSGTALNNNRIMISSSGAIAESTAITASRALISDSNGIPVASSVTSTVLGYLDASSSVQTQLNGKVSLSGDTMVGALAMGANKITSSYVPVNGDDLTNKTYVDNAITGIAWIHPVEVFNLLGNKTIAGLDALSPATGDAYLATDAGTPAAGSSDTLAIGDIAEFNGTSWKKIVSNSGGFAPAGTRAILGGAGGTIYSPYTDATDNEKLVIFSGSSNTGTIQTGVVADQVAVLVQDAGHISYYDNAAYVYEGTPVSGSWVQFNGAGQITAGAGLLKTGNTLDVKFGAGVTELPSDEVGIDLYGSNAGLILTVDGTTPSTATGAKLRAYDIADVNIASAAAISLNKLAAVTANRVLLSDASGFVSASSVTNTTLGYLDATSSIQTQLNGKEATITTLPISKGGTNSGTALNNGRIMSSVGGAIVEAAAITAARVLISDANGIPVHSSVTSTTLGFLDATSSIQTQLNGKEATITTLPISKGGTNSSTALNNNRIIISSSSAIVEASAITASRVLVSDSNGIPVASSITSTTLGYLDATSSIQTQLNAKLDSVSEDTAPQLGGHLDLNSKSLTGDMRRADSGSPTRYVAEDYIDSITLTESTTAVASAFTFDSKVIKSKHIDYTIVEGNKRRAGRLIVVANNAAAAAADAVSIVDYSTETADVGVSWSAAMNGDNVEISYTTSANDKTMRADQKVFLA